MSRGEFCNKICQNLPFNGSSGLILNIKGSERGSLYSYPPREVQSSEQCLQGILSQNDYRMGFNVVRQFLNSMDYYQCCFF